MNQHTRIAARERVTWNGDDLFSELVGIQRDLEIASKRLDGMAYDYSDMEAAYDHVEKAAELVAKLIALVEAGHEP